MDMSNHATDKLVVVDVGAAGGIKDAWVLDGGLSLFPILFEPADGHAEALRHDFEVARGGRVIAAALSDRAESRLLHITAAPGCSSVLAPDMVSLAQYSVRHAFEVRSKKIVRCSRFDELALKEGLPQPDAVKIDVQGFEIKVLSGFGSFLDGVLGIEIETDVYPLYHEQALFFEVVDFMRSHGFYLRKMERVDHFDGYAVEFDTWFTKGPHEVRAMGERQQRKLSCIERTWDLPARREIFSPTMFV